MEVVESEPVSKCPICGLFANCKRHYGAVACRACAAFFRRSITFKTTKKCKKNKKCAARKNGSFICKFCRLQKCMTFGMSYDNFQFERDVIRPQFEIARRIPQTMDIFCGQPNFIIFRAPASPSSSSSPKVLKNYIDLKFLVEHTKKVLVEGPETPIQSRNKLGKMALGLHPLLESRNIVSTEAKRYGRDETLAQLEHDIVTVTKWMTYFDEYQKLSEDIKMKMLEGMWHIWVKLAKYANIASSIRKYFDETEIKKMKKGHCFYSYDSNRIDMSWLSKYTVEELKFFIEIKTEYCLDDLTQAMLNLDPSDVELSYMFGQLCFHYVGKRYQGKILEVAEKFLEILSDDLHHYYINQMKQPYYLKRVADMMKINNQIQKEVFQYKARTDLALVFDVFCVDISHPEMFIEM